MPSRPAIDDCCNVAAICHVHIIGAYGGSLAAKAYAAGESEIGRQGPAGKTYPDDRHTVETQGRIWLARFENRTWCRKVLEYLYEHGGHHAGRQSDIGYIVKLYPRACQNFCV